MIKIKDILDVITNSSNEVFVMKRSLAEHLIQLRDSDSVRQDHMDITDLSNPLEVRDLLRWEEDMVAEVCGIPVFEGDCWDKYFSKYRSIIEEKFKDLVFIDIEDHYDECEDDIDYGYGNSIWNDSRY